MPRLRAIGVAGVEVDQNLPRLSAVARADDAAAFQLIHDARSATVAETQAALEQRHAGLLFATNDFDAVLNDFFVFAAAGFLQFESLRHAALHFLQGIVDFHL